VIKSVDMYIVPVYDLIVGLYRWFVDQVCTDCVLCIFSSFEKSKKNSIFLFLFFFKVLVGISSTNPHKTTLVH